ncbi:MAG: general secretion pathway protein GspK [Planctomycetia bacterium]|nr:general secretion pathway protein GspK [Planctomycetia bacterium]
MNDHSSRKTRRGMAIIVVLVVVTLLSFAAYTFADLMFAEYQAADAFGRSVQARLLCESGAEKLHSLLKLDTAMLREKGGLYDNPAELRAITIIDDAHPADRARFSILASTHTAGSETSLRYGLEDESAKLNLNALLTLHTDETKQRTRLMAVPGMSEEIADSILDWLDDDDEPREFGAEASYYSGLAPAYAPKNGPLDTLEELLLVQGVTRAHLFGLDVDRNGLVDAAERDVLLPENVDNNDGSFDRGWNGYLALHGAEGNRRADGTPRININGDDLEKIYADLQAAGQADLASFIVTYRQNGTYTGSGGANTNLATAPPPDFTKTARYRFKTPLDLVGATTSATVQGNTIAVVSPVKNDPLLLGPMLPILMDLLATTDATVVPGRININQAPRALLQGIPGFTAEQVEQIVAMRYPEPTEQMPGSEYPTWLLSRSIVTLDEMKALLPYVTAAGHVYRAQIIGYYDEGGPAARVETLIDATSTVPRRLLWRDLTHLGVGFSTTTLGIAGP